MRHSAQSVLTELSAMIAEKVNDVLAYSITDDTCYIEGRHLFLSFTFDADQFEIRSVEAKKKGVGGKLITIIHEYCDAEGFSTYASHVKSTAVGFWFRMGYAESATEGEFFRIQ